MLLYERYNNRRRQKSLSFAVFEIFYRFGTAPTVGNEQFRDLVEVYIELTLFINGRAIAFTFFNTEGVVIKN